MMIVLTTGERGFNPRDHMKNADTPQMILDEAEWKLIKPKGLSQVLSAKGFYPRGKVQKGSSPRDRVKITFNPAAE